MVHKEVLRIRSEESECIIYHAISISWVLDVET